MMESVRGIRALSSASQTPAGGTARYRRRHNITHITTRHNITHITTVLVRRVARSSSSANAGLKNPLVLRRGSPNGGA